MFKNVCIVSGHNRSKKETLRTGLLSDLGLRDIDNIHDYTTLEHLRHASLTSKPRSTVMPQTWWVVTVSMLTFTANVPVLDSVDIL